VKVKGKLVKEVVGGAFVDFLGGAHLRPKVMNGRSMILTSTFSMMTSRENGDIMAFRFLHHCFPKTDALILHDKFG
jgi:hypothetical protein